MTPAVGAPLLRVDHVRKLYPGVRSGFANRPQQWVRAVDDVSFVIEEGETLSLVGETGCGKTTTARMILMVERPTEGTIEFRGLSTQAFSRANLREYRTSVQAVFQDPWSSLNPRMHADAIISEPLQATGRMSSKDTRQRVSDLLDAVGLPRSAGRRLPHEFSGGQRQRIAIARALAPLPKLIVLDEPVSGLDVSVRAQIMNLLKVLQIEYGVSYLLISHDLATVRYLAHSVCVMYLGKVVETGPAHSLFGNALHPYTKALVAASLSSDPDAPLEDSVLKGELPSPLNPPAGCAFHPRCPYAMPRCSVETPLLKEMGPTQTVSCHLY